MRFEKVDFNNSEFLYKQVVSVIKDKIKNKEITVGEKLPPLYDFCKMLNVSDITMRKSLLILERERYISRRPNHGTVIISSKPKRLDLEIKNGICFVSCGFTRKDPRYPGDFGEHADITTQSLIFGMEEKIRELGGYLIFTTLGKSGLQITGKENDIAGLILSGDITPKQFRKVEKMNIPLVLTSDLYQKERTSPDVDVIASDDFQAGYMAAKHLADSGHKKIALFVYKEYYSLFDGIDLVKGYRKACKEADKKFSKDREIITDGWNIEDGYKTMKKLLKKPLAFTAIVCVDNLIWHGASKALREKGVIIPKDLSVVNIGTIQELTKVMYDHRNIGRIAVEQLVKRIKNIDSKPERIVVQPRLIDKGSTKEF